MITRLHVDQHRHLCRPAFQEQHPVSRCPRGRPPDSHFVTARLAVCSAVVLHAMHGAVLGRWRPASSLASHRRISVLGNWTEWLKQPQHQPRPSLSPSLPRHGDDDDIRAGPFAPISSLLSLFLLQQALNSQNQFCFFFPFFFLFFSLALHRAVLCSINTNKKLPNSVACWSCYSHHHLPPLIHFV